MRRYKFTHFFKRKTPVFPPLNKYFTPKLFAFIALTRDKWDVKGANSEALHYGTFFRRQYLISWHKTISREKLTDHYVRPKKQFSSSILGQDRTLVSYLRDLALKTAALVWSFLWYSSVPPRKMSVLCLILDNGCFNPQIFEAIIHSP